jgi:hypothetical protein
MAMEIEALLKRAKNAEIKRDAFANLMRDCYRYAMPERDAWSSYGYGQQKITEVYDSTAMLSTARFATRLTNALFPPGQRWARLNLPPETPKGQDAKEMQEDLDQITAKLFAHIHASNFDPCMHEAAHDLAAGVSAILIENGRLATDRARGPLLRFTSVPAALVAFDEGPFGSIEGVFYRQRMAGRNLLRVYADASLPADLRRQIDAQPEDEVVLLQCTTYDAKHDEWCFQVLLQDQKHEMVKRYYRTNPWIITRWMKAPGETYGRGQLTMALPDIRTLNKLRELSLISASFAVTPMWTVLDDGVLNPDTVRITPNALIPVRSNGGPMGASLKAVEMPTRFDIAQTLEAELKTSIRQIMFDNPLPPEVQVGLTATEVIERVRQFQNDTGAFGRLEVDAVRPIITRCLDILEEAGEFAAPRMQGVTDALRQDLVRIVPTSPLSAAQERADVQAVMQLAMGFANLGEMGAAMAKAGLDPMKAGRFIAERSGVPADLIPDEEELENADAAGAEQQQMMQLMQSPVMAQVAGQVAKAATTPPPQPEPMT